MPCLNAFSKVSVQQVYMPAYVETDGTNYIDTGFQPTDNTRIQMVTEVVEVTEEGSFFGSMGAGSSNNVQYSYALLLSGQTIKSYYSGQTLECGDVPEDYIAIYKEDVSTIINGVLYTDTVYGTMANEIYSLYLGATNNAGVATLPGKIKIFACQIYEDEALVRDFIPWTEDGVNGLRDKCDGAFYPLQPIS